MDSSSVSLHFVTHHLVRCRCLEVRIAELGWYVKEKCFLWSVDRWLQCRTGLEEQIGMFTGVGVLGLYGWTISCRAKRWVFTATMKHGHAWIFGYEGNQSFPKLPRGSIYWGMRELLSSWTFTWTQTTIGLPPLFNLNERADIRLFKKFHCCLNVNWKIVDKWAFHWFYWLINLY